MKSKAIPVLVVSLISMLLLMAFSVNVAAEEGDPPELDNDKNIYFRPSETKEKNYDYNYSSDIYSYTTIVGDGDGWYGPEFHYDNQIHLTANVESVTSDEHRNTINFYVVAQGAYEFNETATPGDVDPKDPEWLVDYAGTTHVPIEAEITDMEGGNQEYDIDDFDYDSNTVTGNNMSLQDDEANEEDRDLLMDFLKFQAEARAHAVLDVAPITGPSTVIGTLQAADKYLAPHFLDPDPHPEEEDQDWKPYEKLQKTWPLDYESYGYEEDPDNYRSYSAAAVF